MGNFLSTLAFQFQEALNGVRRTGAMNVATVTTVALSLFILGSFLLFLRNLNALLRNLESQYQVTLFLTKELPQTKLELLQETLRADPAVKEVRYVSRDEALEAVVSEWKTEGAQLPPMEDNPLPDSLAVLIHEGTAYKAFLQRARELPGVEKTASGQEWVGTILAMVDLTRLVGLVAVLVLGCASLLIIANTIKLTVYARREEIAIMKIVGATNWFIRTPFLIEGCLQGLVGASVSLGLLLAGYHFLSEKVLAIAPHVQLVLDPAVLTKLSCQLLLMGMLLGLLGSLLSLRRIMV